MSMGTARLLALLLGMLCFVSITNPSIVGAVPLNLSILGDSFTNQAAAGTNYGAQTTAEVNYTSAPALIKMAYLRFDLEPVSGANVQNASLCLFADSTSSTSTSIFVQYLTSQSNANWDENVITYTNYHPTTGGAATLQTAPANGTYGCVNVTTQLLYYITNGWKNATFKIRNDEPPYPAKFIFQTKETANVPYLTVNYAGAASDYTAYYDTRYCVNSSTTNGTVVSCRTENFTVPKNCVNFQFYVEGTTVTSSCDSATYKSLFLRNPSYSFERGYEQNTSELCSVSHYNKTLYNDLLTANDKLSALCVCYPAIDQYCSLTCAANAYCQVPNANLSFLFPTTSVFDTAWGADVSLYNEIINNGGFPLKVTLKVSDGNWFRLADPSNENTGLYLPNFTQLTVELDAGESYPFTAYFSPSKYGLSPTSNFTALYIYATSNNTASATKQYNLSLSNPIYPATVCGNNICESPPEGNENNVTCPEDCNVPAGTFGGADKPLFDMGNNALNILFTPNVLTLIVSLTASILVMYYLGVTTSNGMVSLFGGAIVFLCAIVIGTYYGLIINWLGIMLILLTGAMAVSMIMKLMGLGGGK